MQQVIYLEAEDDLPAVRDALEGAQARRVMLVVPRHSTLFREPLNLRILRRYAANLALDVALVTRDSRTRRLAKEEGVPVLFSVRGGRGGRWRLRAPHRNPAQQAVAARVERLRAGRSDPGYGDAVIVWSGRAFGLLLFAGLLVLVLAMAAFLIPEAQVTLVPYREVVQVSLSLRADPEVEKASLEDLTVPARLIEVEIDANDSVPTASTRDAPDALATGTITFINQGGTPIDVEAGIIVRTATGTTVRFKTIAPVSLPGGAGQTVTAEIEALAPGPSGNVPAATITEVETPALRGKVRVTNEQPTSGGGVRQVGYVTRADMDRLKAQVLQQVQQRAFAELQAQLQEQEFLPAESMIVEILAEDYDQFLDAEADTLGLQMRVVASGTAVDRANANLMAYEALKQRIPVTYEIQSQEISFTLDEEAVTMDGRSVLIEVTASAPLVVEVDKGEVRSAIAGLDAGEATAVLTDSFSLDAPPVVQIMPEWIKRWEWLDRVPYLPFRIQVVVLE
ncbi:MAG: baseplate J/gp47 family protein [Anaerolineae bacterium]|nr:baseplate J/gp47 family protein [Anaerolineae bacterium]